MPLTDNDLCSVPGCDEPREDRRHCHFHRRHQDYATDLEIAVVIGVVVLVVIACWLIGRWMP